MDQQASSNIETLAALLKPEARVGVLTGAGVSKESGVPTFRDQDGLWNKFRPEELANVDAFLANPERVWEWYSWRRELMAGVEPNAGHQALGELETLLEHFVLVTQNVDGLHRRAGSKDVIEIHGNILRNKCHNCQTIFRQGDAEHEAEFAKGELPRCGRCGGMVRPDVVWFGEMLPEEALERAWSEAQQADVYLSIGTSAAVYPAAALPQLAKQSGAVLVEINPQATELTPLADIMVQGSFAEIMPRVVEQVKRSRDRML